MAARHAALERLTRQCNERRRRAEAEGRDADPRRHHGRMRGNRLDGQLERGRVAEAEPVAAHLVECRRHRHEPRPGQPPAELLQPRVGRAFVREAVGDHDGGARRPPADDIEVVVQGHGTCRDMRGHFGRAAEALEQRGPLAGDDVARERRRPDRVTHAVAPQPQARRAVACACTLANACAYWSISAVVGPGERRQPQHVGLDALGGRQRR